MSLSWNQDREIHTLDDVVATQKTTGRTQRSQAPARDKGTAGRRTSLRVYTCTTSLHTARPFLATRLPVYPHSPPAQLRRAWANEGTISSLQVVTRGRLGVRERTGSRNREGAEDREAAAARQSNADQGTSHRKRVRVVNPSTERMVPVDPPASIVPTRVQYVNEWLSEPPDSELLEPWGWTSVEGILKRGRALRLRPVTQLDGGGSQSAAPSLRYLPYKYRVKARLRLASASSGGGGGREAVVLSDMFRNHAAKMVPNVN
ncbi:hypothetical protein B0H14DRAFT_2571530 [Mycena olivaceomarginata]|nr:hypothetical protein B0H14DRAFT_2571530 [Mycena olivaceomarginata]